MEIDIAKLICGFPHEIDDGKVLLKNNGKGNNPLHALQMAINSQIEEMMDGHILIKLPEKYEEQYFHESQQSKQELKE